MPVYDQLYCNGDIHTLDDRHPLAEALAVKKGRIAAIGSEAECWAVLDNNHETINLKGYTMLPGFIDTHLHPTVMIYFELSLSLSNVRSIDDMQKKVREEGARESKSPWILGLQFDDLALQGEKRVTRHHLDAACANRPVAIVTYDGHRVLANSKALEEAGLKAETEDPLGGKIEREADGYPAGIFHEKATALILDLIPLPEMEELQEAAARTFAKLASCGITSIGAILQTGENGPAGKNGRFDLPLMTILLDQIPLNIYGLLITRDLKEFAEARQSMLHQTSELQNSPGRRIGAVKMFCDGTLQSGTAYMEKPYLNQPENRGFMVQDEEDLYQRMVDTHQAGLQIAIHAIGDAANRTCIKLFDQLLKKYPRPDHRHRIEHASVLNKELVADLARLGLTVSSQPIFIHSEKHWIQKQIGPERSSWTYPFRTLLDAGVKFAASSDAPICFPNVIHALQCCVTREGFVPEQCISITQAVRAFTIDAAYAQFEEGIKGTLSVGKQADLVVLSDNPFKVKSDQISSIGVMRTVCSGKTIFIEKEGAYA